MRRRPCGRRSRTAWTSRRCASRRAGGRECGRPSSRAPSAPSPFLDPPPLILLRARLLLERERQFRHRKLVALGVLVDVDLAIALERLGVEWRDRPGNSTGSSNTSSWCVMMHATQSLTDLESIRLSVWLVNCRKFGAKTIGRLPATIFLTAECSTTRARNRKRPWRMKRFGCVLHDDGQERVAHGSRDQQVRKLPEVEFKCVRARYGPCRCCVQSQSRYAG